MARSDKAFIDKIRTINIGTGAAPPKKPCTNPTVTNDPNIERCSDCGSPLMEVVGVVVKTKQQKKGKK